MRSPESKLPSLQWHCSSEACRFFNGGVFVSIRQKQTRGSLVFLLLDASELVHVILAVGAWCVHYVVEKPHDEQDLNAFRSHTWWLAMCCGMFCTLYMSYQHYPFTTFTGGHTLCHVLRPSTSPNPRRAYVPSRPSLVVATSFHVEW